LNTYVDLQIIGPKDPDTNVLPTSSFPLPN